MTVENTTTANETATLTEQELFAEFLETPMPLRPAMFGASGENYKPDDWLRDPGLESRMEDYTNALTDWLTTSDAPGDDLREILTDLENYTRMVRHVCDDFEWVKEVRLIDAEDADVERYQPLSPEPDFVELTSADEAVIKGKAA